MDERDPGANTEMFQAFVERREQQPAAPAAAGNRGMAVAIAVAVAVVLVVLALVVL